MIVNVNYLKIHLTYLTLSLLSVSFLRENEQFFLENASNLTHEFLYDNFKKKI